MATQRELLLRYYRKLKPALFNSGIGAKLPDAYKKFYNEWRKTPPEAVNYIPYTGKTWVRDDETGEIKRFENVPIPGKLPKELEYVFTGGEKIIQGFVKKRKYASPSPKFWTPVIYRSVVYSEILDKYLSALVTKRVVELIHKHQGFDNYLLQNKACDLGNLVALKVKQKLLLALDERNLPYDEEKNNLIFKKYEKYLIPREEIEWYGLTFGQACRKWKEIEKAQMEASIIPLKHVYRAQLFEELKNPKDEKDDEVEKSSIKNSIQKVLKIDRFIKK